MFFAFKISVSLTSLIEGVQEVSADSTCADEWMWFPSFLIDFAKAQTKLLLLLYIFWGVKKNLSGMGGLVTFEVISVALYPEWS